MAKGRLRRRLAAVNQDLTSRHDADLVDVLSIPERFVSPWRRIFTRVLLALGALFAAVLIVYVDRHGYRDIESAPNANDPLSFLDCLYYATVSLSTTGYGDITPVTPSARLINVLVITPLRVAFLIVLIGTTVETLTTQSRQALKIQRWRSTVRNHTIVVGYGTKGRSAVAALLAEPDNLQAAFAAAQAGADRTLHASKAGAGRASYLNSDSLRGNMDPGAHAVAMVFKALAQK